MTQLLRDTANGKMVLALEGGYNLKSISKSAAECVRVLLGGTPKPMEASRLEKIDPIATKTIEEVIQLHSKYWKCFDALDDLTQKLQSVDISKSS
jgi:acetoin utilization deacetylase AcuC-like enzyme